MRILINLENFNFEPKIKCVNKGGLSMPVRKFRAFGKMGDLVVGGGGRFSIKSRV